MMALVASMYGRFHAGGMRAERASIRSGRSSFSMRGDVWMVSASRMAAMQSVMLNMGSCGGGPLGTPTLG